MRDEYLNETLFSNIFLKRGFLSFRKTLKHRGYIVNPVISKRSVSIWVTHSKTRDLMIEGLFLSAYSLYQKESNASNGHSLYFRCTK